MTPKRANACGSSWPGRAGARVDADAGGNFLLTGVLAETADFGGGPLASAGNSDVFVAKLVLQIAALVIGRVQTRANFPASIELF
jgi:hypothetical protein